MSSVHTGVAVPAAVLFRPYGLAGHACWWGVPPFHAAVFGGMARNIAAAAESAPLVPAEPARTGGRGTVSVCVARVSR